MLFVFGNGIKHLQEVKKESVVDQWAEKSELDVVNP
jgi:hypothetical protein